MRRIVVTGHRPRLETASVSPARPSDIPLPAAFAEISDEVPPPLLGVVAAAIDQLEIAAALETWGLSNAFVRERLGQADVFSLAEQLYDEVEYRTVPVSDTRARRPGHPMDLARGLVFAAPTLMFAGAAVALRTRLSWWSMPLALICGWTLGQFVSFVGFSQRAGGKATGSAVAWSLIAAVICCAGLGFAADVLLGGGMDAVLLAVIACIFMTASAVLVAHDEVHLVALMLVPGAIGALVFITHEPFTLSAPIAALLAGTSVLIMLAAALRHIPARWWHVPPVPRAGHVAAFRYAVHGLCCGLFVALFVALDPAQSGTRGWPAVAAYPMILSLGVMEWQLRSLRSAARQALLRSYTVARFTRLARKALFRSASSYLAALIVLTALMQALAFARSARPSTTLVVDATLLGTAFFLALVVASCGRMDLVLRCWLAGFTLYGGWLLIAWATGSGISSSTARLAFCLATSVALVGLAAAASVSIANPNCHS
jgi:hypothetical protein